VWFRAEHDGAKAGLTIFVPGYAEGTRLQDRRYICCWTTLSASTTSESRVGFIEIKPVPADPKRQGLHLFVELPQAVDRLLERAH